MLFRSKSFMGTSKNAVLTQRWIAMIYFMLLAYIKFQSRYKYSLHTLAQIVGSTLFQRASLMDLLNLNLNNLYKLKLDDMPQLMLPLRH